MPNPLSQVFERLRGSSFEAVYPGAQPGPWPVAAVNEAEDYGVRIEPARVLPGTWYWQAVRVDHLSPAENGGKHHIYMDLYEPFLDARGRWHLRRLDGGRLRVTWQGGGEQVLTIDKPANEPGTNMPMWREQICSVWALGLPGAEAPSDCVTGLQSNHPDEGHGNSRFHHSFSIIFQKVQVPTAPILPPAGQQIAHYVLFGPAEQPNTMANLWLAQDYLLTFRPAFGFNPEEAAHASRVTIVADRTAVGADVERRLADKGVRVDRVEGNLVEVSQALAERVARGER